MCAANEVAVPMGSHVANMNECGRYRCASGQHIASELTLGLYSPTPIIRTPLGREFL